MKKKLLTILFPVAIAIACSIAVWANEPSATEPACDKCPKADKSAASAKDAKAAAECAKLKSEGKPCGEEGCDKHAMDGAAAQGCDKCRKMKTAAAAMPCGEGCDKGAKDGAAAQGCDKCPKMKAAAAKPCGEGCDKGAKPQQPEKKP